MPQRAVSSAAFVLLFAASTLAHAASSAAQSNEERFQDLFVTAGYATAFGAALGTAFLAFTPDPAENLHFVAVGASLGFIGGSILGSYVIFSPMLARERDEGQDIRLAYQGTKAPRDFASRSLLPAKGLVIKPTFEYGSGRVMAFEAGKTLLRW